MPFAQQRTLSTTIKSMMIRQGWIEENWRWQRLDGFMTWSVLSIVCLEIFTVLEVQVGSRLNSGVYSNHALAMPQLPSDHVYAALMITESANRLTRRHLSRLVQNEYVQNPGPPQTRNSLPLEIWTKDFFGRLFMRSFNHKSIIINQVWSILKNFVSNALNDPETNPDQGPGSFLCTQLLKKLTVRRIFWVPNCNIQSNSALCMPLCVTHSQIPRASLCVTHS